METLQIAVVTIVLLASAFLIFRFVGADYRKHGRLTLLSTFLETFVFFLHGAASYFYLSADAFSTSLSSDPWYIAGGVLMVVGFALTIAAMARLGMRKTLGQQVPGLQIAGFYKYSRNPQVVAYALVVIGCALMWPTWWAIVWILDYFVIAHIMISTEEEHLRRVFGQEYKQYCASVPRYVGLLKRVP